MSLKTSFIKPNRSFASGGGATSNILHHQLGKKGVLIGFGALGVAGVAAGAMDIKNQKEMGPVTYQGGPTRMTNIYGTGAIQAINDMTDDPEVRAEMVKNIMHDNTSILDSVEQHGVDGQFLSAFYGMG